MTAPMAQQTRATELINELGSLSEQVGEIPEFTLRRIERDARTTMAADASGTHTVLGAIASLRNDAALVRHHFKIALEQDPHNAEVRYNQSVALSQVGMNEEAFAATLKACKLVPDSRDYLLRAIHTAITWAKFDTALELHERCERLQPHDGKTKRQLLSAALTLKGAIECGHLEEERVRALLHMAHEIRAGERIRCRRTSGEPDPTQFGTYFVDLDVLDSPKRAVELNFKLADRLAEEQQQLYRLHNHVKHYCGPGPEQESNPTQVEGKLVITFIGML